MKAIAAGTAIVVLSVSCVLLLTHPKDQLYEHEKHQIMLEEQRANLEAQQRWAAQTQPYGIALHNASVIVAVLAMSGTVVVLFIGSVRWSTGQARREEIAYRLDMARIEATKAIGVAMAQPQPVPLHYHPTIQITNTSTGASHQLTSGDIDQIEALVTPTFRELLDAGMVGKGNGLLLGYADGEPMYGDWRDLYSSGIGGVSGSGKSWTGAFLLAQSVMHGGRVAILDPHAGDSESLSSRLSPLSSRFLCETASESRDMLQVVRMVASELERRVRTREHREPWIIVCDEFSSLMRGELKEPLSGLFEAIAQEGRKLQVFGMCLGQVWTTTRSGGSELRDSLASCYVHRLRPAQARYLTGLTASELPKDLLDLPAGTGYLLNTRGELTRITMPEAAPQDVQRIAGLLPCDVPTMTIPASENGTCEATEPYLEVGTKPGFPPVESDKPLSAQEQHILALAKQATPISRIVAEVFGVRGGARYQEHTQEVMTLIASRLVV